GEDGLERDGEGRAAMRGEHDLGRARPAGAWAPAHAMVDRRRRLGSALIQAARGGDAAAGVPAPALAVLVDGEVRAAVVAMDRRPQPEELGRHARGAALGFSDGTHAPRAIARPGRAIGEDRDFLVAEADVPFPEAELGEACEIHQYPALGPVREARLLDRAGA